MTPLRDVIAEALTAYDFDVREVAPWSFEDMADAVIAAIHQHGHEYPEELGLARTYPFVKRTHPSGCWYRSGGPCDCTIHGEPVYRFRPQDGRERPERPDAVIREGPKPWYPKEPRVSLSAEQPEATRTCVCGEVHPVSPTRRRHDPDMTPTVAELHATADATVWAAAFLSVLADDETLILDEGWVIGWFANAIETGRTHGGREHTGSPGGWRRLFELEHERRQEADARFKALDVAASRASIDSARWFNERADAERRCADAERRCADLAARAEVAEGELAESREYRLRMHEQEWT